jgi:hypothetical protein
MIALYLPLLNTTVLVKTQKEERLKMRQNIPLTPNHFVNLLKKNSKRVFPSLILFGILPLLFLNAVTLKVHEI